MNSDEKLAAMVNQIAANRLHEPDPAAATAEHIRLYWDPRMKQMIRGYVGGTLSPVASAAVALLATDA